MEQMLTSDNVLHTKFRSRSNLGKNSEMLVTGGGICCSKDCSRLYLVQVSYTCSVTSSRNHLELIESDHLLVFSNKISQEFKSTTFPHFPITFD